MEGADPTIPGLSPPNPVVLARLVLTLLFLPVADLREHVGFAQLYRDDVGEAFRPSASLQSALYRAVSRPPGPCGSSRTLDRSDSQVDLVTEATRATLS